MALLSGLRRSKPTAAEPLSFSSYDSMEGVEYAPVQATTPRRTRWESVRRVMPGLTIAGVVALAAAWLADHYAAPVMLFALLLGMAVNFVSQDPRCRPGIDFAARNVLRLGVALLGARITIAQVQALGGETLLVAVTAVALTVAVGWALARALKLRPEFGVLTGGSVAICGASAALAIASVLPNTPERERETLLTVVGVTTLSTVAMVLYPVLASGLGLDAEAAGVFLGATIHDVAQVVGAGYSLSETSGDTATVVKLFRVALLLPVVLLIALMFRSGEGKAAPGRRRPPLLPGFLVAFAVLVLINSTGQVPPVVTDQLEAASRWALVAAIAALGAKTSLGELAHVGWRPVLLIVAETLAVLAWVLAAILLLG